MIRFRLWLTPEFLIQLLMFCPFEWLYLREHFYYVWSLYFTIESTSGRDLFFCFDGLTSNLHRPRQSSATLHRWIHQHELLHFVKEPQRHLAVYCIFHSESELFYLNSVLEILSTETNPDTMRGLWGLLCFSCLGTSWHFFRKELFLGKKKICRRE